MTLKREDRVALSDPGMDGLTFEERLVFLRERAGMNQSELAEKVGTSRTLISMMESGKNPNPSRLLLRKLSDVFEVTLDYLDDGRSGDESLSVMRGSGIFGDEKSEDDAE